MAIACAYCNGEHDTPAQVRQCWNDGGRQDIAVADDPIPHPADSLFDSEPPRRTASAPSSRRATTRVAEPVERGVAVASPGPDQLGRHLVIEPGGAIAEPWITCDRLVIDEATLSAPARALERLRRAHHSATRVVIELAASFEREPMLMTEAAPYELGPTFQFELEELHHLVWANSVDARDAELPVWLGLDRAVAAGARAVEPGGVGDVVLPDGTVAWVDGGPTRHVDPID